MAGSSREDSLLQRTPTGLPAFITPCEHPVPSRKQMWDFTGWLISEHPDLGLHASRTLRKECMLFRSYLVACVLLHIVQEALVCFELKIRELGRAGLVSVRL